MMRVFTAEMVQAGLELGIRRSEADVLQLQLAGDGGAALHEAEDDLKSAVENLADFFVLTGDQDGAPIGRRRSEGLRFSLN